AGSRFLPADGQRPLGAGVPCGHHPSGGGAAVPGDGGMAGGIRAYSTHAAAVAPAAGKARRLDAKEAVSAIGGHSPPFAFNDAKFPADKASLALPRAVGRPDEQAAPTMLFNDDIPGHGRDPRIDDDGVPILFELVVVFFWLIQSQVKAQAGSTCAQHDAQCHIVLLLVLFSQKPHNFFVGFRRYRNHPLPPPAHRRVPIVSYQRRRRYTPWGILLFLSVSVNDGINSW